MNEVRLFPGNGGPEIELCRRCSHSPTVLPAGLIRQSWYRHGPGLYAVNPGRLPGRAVVRRDTDPARLATLFTMSTR
ncbi:MAG: hypothetical protein WDN69_29075 [Aliidongia sp.]